MLITDNEGSESWTTLMILLTNVLEIIISSDQIKNSISDIEDDKDYSEESLCIEIVMNTDLSILKESLTRLKSADSATYKERTIWKT